MKEKYRVVIIVPFGYVHSQCFTEVAFLIRNTLRDMEMDCDLTVNEMATDRINVVLGFHLLQNHESLKKFRYIPYQLEQLSAIEGVFSPTVQQILSDASSVWDYSQENIAFLKQYGIQAKHVPVGFHRSLQQIVQQKDKDIDVLFFGSLGPRREVIINQLMNAAGLRVKTLFGVYSKERDEAIARAKIVLNVHHYNAKIFEAVRVSYLLNNACCVVSEESSVYPYPGVGLALVPYDSLVQTCATIVSAGNDFEAMGQSCFNQFKTHYAMGQFLSKAITA